MPSEPLDLVPVRSSGMCFVKGGAGELHGMKHHISVLSVLHYVFGTLICVGGLFLLFFVALGGFLSSDWLAEQSNEPPPLWLGGFLQTLGWVLFIFAEIWGVLNIVSGYNISVRKGRTLSFVTAALNCLNVPFGLGLGIYTFIALSDAQVRQEYGLPA